MKKVNVKGLGTLANVAEMSMQNTENLPNKWGTAPPYIHEVWLDQNLLSLYLRFSEEDQYKKYDI